MLKDLLRKDVRNMSNIGVLATCQSRSALHQILVSSRGTHLVQEVLNISPPDKVCTVTWNWNIVPGTISLFSVSPQHWDYVLIRPWCPSCLPVCPAISNFVSALYLLNSLKDFGETSPHQGDKQRSWSHLGVMWLRYIGAYIAMLLLTILLLEPSFSCKDTHKCIV